MELIFADDSGKESRENRYILVAGVCFHESRLRALETHIAGLKGLYQIPERYELHWKTRNYRRRVNGAWRTDRELTVDEQDALRQAFLAFLANADARVIVAAVERGGASETAPLVAECLEYIAERAQMHLQELWYRDQAPALGLLIADEPGSGDERREVERRLSRLHRSGTQYISSFDNLVMNSLLYPSHLVPGIQLADFVAGAFNRLLNRDDTTWWPLVEPFVRRQQNTDRVLGYGLKIWPPPVNPLRIGNIEIR